MFKHETYRTAFTPCACPVVYSQRVSACSYTPNCLRYLSRPSRLRILRAVASRSPPRATHLTSVAASSHLALPTPSQSPTTGTNKRKDAGYEYCRCMSPCPREGDSLNPTDTQDSPSSRCISRWPSSVCEWSSKRTKPSQSSSDAPWPSCWRCVSRCTRLETVARADRVGRSKANTSRRGSASRTSSDPT